MFEGHSTFLMFLVWALTLAPRHGEDRVRQLPRATSSPDPAPAPAPAPASLLLLLVKDRLGALETRAAAAAAATTGTPTTATATATATTTAAAAAAPRCPGAPGARRVAHGLVPAPLVVPHAAVVAHRPARLETAATAAAATAAAATARVHELVPELLAPAFHQVGAELAHLPAGGTQ